MTRFALRMLVAAALTLAAVPSLAQTPGVDENDCKASPLMSRIPRTLEGEVEHLKLVCAASSSQLQLVRNAEAALKKSGYTVVFSGRHANHDNPAVTAQKGAQWIMVQTSAFNEFPTYEQTAVLVKEMPQEMSATAQAMSDAITKSGKLDVYGITFATGQAAISPASDQVLADVQAVLTANADWRLRIEGHTDNVGDKAANLKLSNARAAAVAAWLIGKGINASRLAVAGLGDTQPVADNATEDGRARNRRVVLVKP